MTIEGALTAYLLADTALKAIISTKLHPDELPQGTIPPAVVYAKISDIKDHTLTGMSTLHRPMIQFTAFGKTKSEAVSVSNALQRLLNDYHGTLSGVVIQHIRLENEMSTKDVSSDGTLRLCLEVLEYQISYERT